MKKLIVILIISIISIVLIFFLWLFLKPKNKNIIEAFGNIEIRQVDLSFQVAGIIDNIFVEEGDYVKKGDLLATIDNRDYVANYKKALFMEKSLKAQAKEDYSIYKRNNPLCSDGTVSKQECETYLNKKDLSQAQYEESSANREFQKNQLDYTKMYAPQNGIITTRAQEKGARVNANQIVFTMSLTEPVWVRTYIKETDLGNIKYGKKARVLTDTIDLKTGEKKEYEGFIGYISPTAEFTPKTVQTQDLRVDLVYRIRVYINEVDEFLRQGMPVSIKINLNEE